MTLLSFLLFAFLITLQQLHAQVSVYQYRHVPADKVEEFIKRETTYWSKVAQKALDAKKMNFWGLFEKVGGYDLPNSSNFLFINGFSNIDSAWSGDTFDPAKQFPKVPMAQMETGSFTTVTSQIFLKTEDWAEAKGINPEKDFNYSIKTIFSKSGICVNCSGFKAVLSKVIFISGCSKAEGNAFIVTFVVFVLASDKVEMVT